MSDAKLENVQRENKLFKVEILRRTRKILNIISRFLDSACGAYRYRRQKVFSILPTFWRFYENLPFFTLSVEKYASPFFIAFVMHAIALRTFHPLPDFIYDLNYYCSH